jgi:CO/xanthine dehydrogenase Mo-binding subunit
MSSLVLERVERWVGKSVKRFEDQRLIKGKGTFVEDIKLPNHGGNSIEHREYRFISIS